MKSSIQFDTHMVWNVIIDFEESQARIYKLRYILSLENIFSKQCRPRLDAVKYFNWVYTVLSDYQFTGFHSK